MMREFKVNGYGLKYNVTLECILVALFGIEHMKREMDKKSRGKEVQILV